MIISLNPTSVDVQNIILGNILGIADEDITQIKKYEDLPVNCRKYIERVQEILDCPISVVSVGPDRNQNIYIRKI